MDFLLGGFIKQTKLYDLHKMKHEFWEIIKDEPNYQVSNKGRFRSVDRYIVDSKGRRRFYKGTALSPSFDHRGYLRVTIGYNKKLKMVHRLVAEAFYPEIAEKFIDKVNPRIEFKIITID